MIHPKERGLLDFLAATVAVVAVYTGTPIGGLVDRAVGVLLGVGGPQDSLIHYFEVAPDAARDRVPGQELAHRALAQTSAQDESLGRVRRRDLDPLLARAFAVVASGGAVSQDPKGTLWYDVRPLPHHAQDAHSLGLSAPLPAGDHDVATLRRRLASALDLLAAYRGRLGGIDAALAAYALGLPVVERAVARARLTGAPNPEHFDAFVSFFTRRDAARARPFVYATRSLQTAYRMRWPLDGDFPVTSGFGMRIHPILGRRMEHDGVDLGAPEGTPIRAAADGWVRYAKADGVNGLYVKLDHGYGLETAYCHASRVLVREGQWVRQGQIVARVGASGRATGPHLHYGVFVGGHPVDPALFRPANLDLDYQIETPEKTPWDAAGALPSP